MVLHYGNSTLEYCHFLWSYNNIYTIHLICNLKKIIAAYRNIVNAFVKYTIIMKS